VTIELSFNEIYSETQKAIRSLNIDWGIAKDTAILSRWLAQHEIYFLGSLLKTTDLFTSQNISLSINKNSFEKPLSVALMGILLIEYVSANKIVWEGFLNSPKFLIAAMSIMASEQKINFELYNKNKKLIAITENEKSYANFKDLELSTDYFILNINVQNQKHKLKKITPSEINNASKVNEKCWNKLKLMAFETYVPDSEASLSGAGY
jgi:hypothetical protein